MPSFASITRELEKQSHPEDARKAQRFFKTGPGEYGEGDIFRGIRMPVLRSMAKEHEALSLDHTEQLLNSAFHEDRVLALLILVRKYNRADKPEKDALFSLYTRSIPSINNWDLVDVSAPYLPGPHLFTRDRRPLFQWAGSSNLWYRRVAIMSTFYFIRQGDFEDTLSLAELLLNDQEDLMHKAVGWMLREVGNRDRAKEETFLKRYATTMPRTMLRYAIEKFPPEQRAAYMKRP